MADMAKEYLIRVRTSPDGVFVASIRQFAGAQHPEVRAVQGAVSRGEGANEPAAMLAAIAAMHLGVSIREVSRVD